MPNPTDKGKKALALHGALVSGSMDFMASLLMVSGKIILEK